MSMGEVYGSGEGRRDTYVLEGGLRSQWEELLRIIYINITAQRSYIYIHGDSSNNTHILVLLAVNYAGQPVSLNFRTGKT